MNKYYHSLELHKILGLLSEYCSNEFTRKKALELEPSNDIDFVKNEITKTSTALELSIKYGTPVFINISNIIGSLERADSGSTLSIGELIEIRRVL